MGERAWVYSEPPLTIGRGLTAATGAIGGLLAMAVLWTMLPTQAGRNVVATARSTIVELTGTGLVTNRTTVPADPVTSLQSTTPSSSVTTSLRPVAGLDPQTSVTTTLPRSVPTYQVTVGSAVSPGAVAVSVNGGSLLITTAQAVTADLMVDLLLADGSTSAARVLFVDDRSGLAVLSPMAGEDGAPPSGIESFTVAPTVSAGDELTFFGDHQMTLTVTDENTIDSVWADDESIREGTPVVNQRGELVALCTHSNGVGRLVQLGNLDELQQAIASYSLSATVWFGIAVKENGGELTIDAVDPAGPAATAGLVSGDVVQSLDGTAVSDSHGITALLAVHHPGDVVPVGVRHVDGSIATLSVTLGDPKTTL